jgi:hypothetical protein
MLMNQLGKSLNSSELLVNSNLNMKLDRYTYSFFYKNIDLMK